MIHLQKHVNIFYILLSNQNQSVIFDIKFKFNFSVIRFSLYIERSYTM